MSEAQTDVRLALAEAFQAADPQTAWYYDHLRRRVVTVRAGETNIPDLSAAEVEDNELRYLDIPAVSEAEVHDWMADFVEGRTPALGGLLDERKGANRRFLEALGREHPDALAEWRAFLELRVLGRVESWLQEVEEEVRSRPTPEEGPG